MSDAVREQAIAVYEHLKSVMGGRSRSRRRRRPVAEEADNVPFGSGRDPRGVASVVDELTERLGWGPTIARSELLASWRELVGDELAGRSEPVGLTEGILTVRCDSTAWATQLRLMRGDVLRRIQERFPDAGVESVRFQGPDAPSWKRGRRTVHGRGPRDTYG